MSASKFSDPDMQEIFEGFLIETNELLDSLSQDLMEIEINPDDVDLINRIFRSFHTIKGTSSFMGFAEIAEITHHAEDILNKLRRGELVINQPIIDVLLEVHDWITILINKIQTDDNRPIDYSNTISIIEKLKKSTTEEEEEEAIASALSGSAKSDDADNNALGKVLENEEFAQGPGDFTDEELALLEAAFHESNKQFFNTTLQSESQNIIDDEVYTDSFEPNMEREEIEETPPVKIEDTAKFEKPDKSSNIPNKGLKSKTSAETTIRVDVNRVESLMDLSGELVLGRNRLAQITEKIQHYFKNKEIARELIETTAQVDFVTSEIQAAVMRMRMVPIAKLYQKAPRIVRDLAKEFGKKINLVVKGEETEIDRGIIEELNDPLVHMIRNSCDHGVESVADREAAGKPSTGTITLDAEQEGNNIVLRISDDGKGMDPDKLKAKAVEKGIITQEQAVQMGSQQAFQLIFLPGFSTAAKVSSVSGRGVGMDVVRTNIQNLKGMIEIESELGKGSTFVIKLPLTLAIIQGLLVMVQGETYALPLGSVVEVVAIQSEMVYSINQQEVIRIRNEVIPLVRLDSALNTPTKMSGLDDRNVVVVGLGIQRIGLVVDELLGQQEIVIKSLGEYLGDIVGIAGSTIMGDGRVIMIIDVAELIQSLYDNSVSQFKV